MQKKKNNTNIVIITPEGSSEDANSFYQKIKKRIESSFGMPVKCFDPRKKSSATAVATLIESQNKLFIKKLNNFRERLLGGKFKIKKEPNDRG
jgi:RNase H-fold protein (predicted Holliday junction resolvase)